MNLSRVLLGLAVWCMVVGCRVLEPAVARQVDGVVTEGRFIEPEAYALYAAAAVREARGEWRQALELYQRGLSEDGSGPELHTRIGAVACKLKQPSLADRAFASAARADADYGPLWFELAHCRQSRGEIVAALGAALEAVRLDPERYEASLLAADLAEQRGDRPLAWRLRDGLATHAASPAAVQTSILSAAVRGREPARAQRASDALAALGRRQGASSSVPGGVRDALVALEGGGLAAAKGGAQRVLGPDPGNADALVIALVVADLEQDSRRFEALVGASGEPGSPISREVVSLLAGLLGRRVGPEVERLVQPRP